MATYVLVHGAWGGGWIYKGTARALREAGHDVYVPTLTGLGERVHLASPAITLSTHIADVVGVLEREGLEDVILVGHSYGGMVVTGVAAAAGSRIRTLVYLDAFLPQDGENLWDIADDRARKHYIDGQRDTPGLVAPFPGTGRALDPHPLITLLEPVRFTGAEKAVRNHSYIYATRGIPTIFTKFYDRVKADPAWRVLEVDAGHVVMADAPDDLVRILLDEAER
jgi:pimeloyl-ACP methyl ester carboxylesterase